MLTAADLALVFAGVFLLLGMLTGIWKYHHIMSSDDSQAPVYVDIAHRTSLMYSFATLVLFAMAERSIWSDWVNTLAVLASVTFYAAAIASYVIHGVLRDTDNQLARPHRFGHHELPAWTLRVFMLALIVCEIGGAGVLFGGMLRGMLLA